jgi:hypothetical protein
MFADDRLMAGQGHGGYRGIGKLGVASGCDSVCAEGNLPSPHPTHRIEGVYRNFSPYFPSTGFVWQMAVSFRSVLRHPGGDAMGRLLPLLRVNDLKGV